MASSRQEQHWEPWAPTDIFRCQHLHPWSWWRTPKMEQAAKLSVKPFPGELRGAERDWFSVRLKNKNNLKKSRLTGCQMLVKILLRKTQPHLSAIKGNLLSTSVGCGSSAGILCFFSSPRQNALHLRSKTRPPTKDSWRRSDGYASSGWFVTQLLFAWQRTDTLSELSRKSALICFHRRFRTSSQGDPGCRQSDDSPSHHQTTITCLGKWAILMKLNTFSWSRVWI